MRPFIHENWLLQTPQARMLYHEVAAQQPIIDYHNHLSPAFVASNHQFENLSQAWLGGDHYKWRAMRAHGIKEAEITGPASDQDKFRAYAKTVPYTVRNPLFHWSQLELKRYFQIDEYLNPASADVIYERANSILNSPGGSCQQLLLGQKVRVICTTDDPVDDLIYHQQFAGQTVGFKMLPAWRPDKALLIGSGGWLDYMEQLQSAASMPLRDYADLRAILANRMDYFAKHGCCLSDHGLTHVPNALYDEVEADKCLRKRLAGEQVTTAEVATFIFTLLVDMGQEYSRRGWVMQLHLGALRNNNTRGERELGPDTGFDSIGDFPQAQGLSKLLDTLEDSDQLPKTILYNLNPADNEVFATMIGNFAGGGITGKIQWGSAWWFLDQWDGMRKQLETLSNLGLLAHFIGMLTDSRSFLSFPRHEYFRRLLCDLIGQDMSMGRLPNDPVWMGELVAGICYGNAAAYFDF